MSLDEKKIEQEGTQVAVLEPTDADDQELVALGYKPSFKREFTNLATVRLSTLAEEKQGVLTVLLFRSVLRSVSWCDMMLAFSWSFINLTRSR